MVLGLCFDSSGLTDTFVQMYGQKKPSDIMRDQIASYCGTVGTCIGAGTDVDVGSTQYLDGSTLEDLDISFTAVGQYPAWVHNGLIDLLAESIDSQTTTDNGRSHPLTGQCLFADICASSLLRQLREFRMYLRVILSR